MTSLTIKLPEELKLRLEAEAHLRGKSVSALARESIAQTLKKTGSKKVSLFERNKDLCGAGSSGVPDLATNPKYMKGFGAWRP
jgi:plasmid stability protein